MSDNSATYFMSDANVMTITALFEMALQEVINDPRFSVETRREPLGGARTPAISGYLYYTAPRENAENAPVPRRGAVMTLRLTQEYTESLCAMQGYAGFDYQVLYDMIRQEFEQCKKNLLSHLF